MSSSPIEKFKQDVLTGSARLVARAANVEDRVSYMIRNIRENRAYQHLLSRSADADPGDLAEKMALRYREYRRRWSEQPKECIATGQAGVEMLENGNVPLCLDIETAAICDLACEFCYRESIATPDKFISEVLFRSIVDQAAALGVPSIKLNWRGEPLLHPALPKFVDYAKRAGILETIINTNATNLNGRTARGLIEAGLDLMIYSFDGGTKETYERMRPGRFKKNRFEDVYRNIVEFAELREKMGRKFPRTKIQMILTKETYPEQESFFNLFDKYVDEVTVTQYSERGGSVEDLNEAERQHYRATCREFKLPEGAPYLRDAEGNISVAVGRRPCEQPYQRMMITYDGRVAMCCYDWGAMHPIGYVHDASFADPDADKRPVMKNVATGRRGFTLMKKVQMPPKFNDPVREVSPLRSIWTGQEVAKVRSLHLEGKVDDVTICCKCPFKDTYEWVPSSESQAQKVADSRCPAGYATSEPTDRDVTE